MHDRNADERNMFIFGARLRPSEKFGFLRDIRDQRGLAGLRDFARDAFADHVFAAADFFVRESVGCLDDECVLMFQGDGSADEPHLLAQYVQNVVEEFGDIQLMHDGMADLVQNRNLDIVSFGHSRSLSFGLIEKSMAEQEYSADARIVKLQKCKNNKNVITKM